MNWLFYSLLTILLYSIHDILLKKLSASPNASLASLIINASAAIVLLVMVAINYVKQKTGINILPKEGMLMIGAGAALGLATVTFIQAFSQQGAFSVVVPTVYIGIILISVIAGYLLFQEVISYKQLAGIALSCVGLYLLAHK